MAPNVSDELERWLSGDGDKTLGGLTELFEKKSFALLFVLWRRPARVRAWQAAISGIGNLF